MGDRNTHEHLFVGWDVGGWNCEKNGKSRDAVVVIDRNKRNVGEPWWGNLRETINAADSASCFLARLFALCSIDESTQAERATLAIDAPLGFPKQFVDLVSDGVPSDVDQPGKSRENTYLFRHTERQLEIDPLSAIKDMIGSQATKAMHVVAKFAPERLSKGVWTDGSCLTVIETYPALCRARLPVQADMGSIPKTGRKADIRDADLCARIARCFHLHREHLDAPTDDAPASEGWIWAPKPGSCHPDLL